MNKRWTKLISVVCLVAMLIGMLPVVALAADGVYTLDFSRLATGTTVTSGGEDSYFTISYTGSSSAKIVDNQSGKKWDDSFTSENTFVLAKTGSSFTTKPYISFTTTNANATVEVWVFNTGSDARNVQIYNAKGAIDDLAAVSVEKGSPVHPSFKLAEAGQYYIVSPSGTLYIAKVVVTDKAASTTPVTITSVDIKTDGLDVQGDKVYVTYGDTVTLTADVVASDGATANDKKVEWSAACEDGSVEINKDTGALTLNKAGTATITATSTKDKGKSDSINLVVNKKPLTLGVELEGGDEQVTSDGGDVFVNVTGLEGTDVKAVDIVKVDKEDATVGANDGTNKDEYPVKVSLPKNETDADVTYTITAEIPANNEKYTGKTATGVTATVLKPGSVDLDIGIQNWTPLNTSVKEGETLTLTVDAAAKKSKTEFDTTAELTFKWTKDGQELTTGTDNVTITNGTCEESGHEGHHESTLTVTNVTTADAGTYVCTVSITGNDTVKPVSDRFQVKVLPKVKEVTISGTPADNKMMVGDTADLTAVLVPTDAHNVGIYWVSDDAEVLTVNTTPGQGTAEVEAKAAGTATVTVYVVEDDAWLTTADTTNFPKSTKTATVTINVLDATKLEEAIQAAENEINVPNPDDEEGNKTNPDDNWISPADKATFQTAIDAANKALTDAKTQADLDKALKDLEAAQTTFQKYKDQFGTNKDVAKHYTVTVAATVTEGTAKAANKNGKTYYVEGDTVIVTVTPAEGYKVEAVTVTTKSGKTVDVTEADGKYTFTMPAEDVTVKATFVKDSGEVNPPKEDTYTVTVDTEATQGTVTVDKTAKAGDTVTVTVAPAEGYEVDAVTVTTKSGTPVDVTEADGKYTFTMPAEEVTVKVTYKATVPPIPEGTVWKFDAATDITDLADGAALTGKTFGDGHILTFGNEKNPAPTKKGDAATQIKKQLQSGFTFTIPAGSAPATVVVVFASTGPDNDSQVGLYTGDAVDTATKVDEKTGLTQAHGIDGTAFTYEKVGAGTYWVVCDDPSTRDARVLSITVTFGDVKPETVDKTALDAAIKDAQDKLNGVTASVDGTDVPTDKTWATQDAIDALNAAIKAAQDVQAKADATQAEVNAAVKTLTDATDLFKPEQGSQQGGEEPTEITITINTSKITVRKTEKMRYTLTPADAVYGTIYWVSDDTSVLSVTADGQATGVKTGKANVTAYVLKSAADGLDKDNILAEATREIQVVSATTIGGGGSTTGQTTTPATTTNKTNSNGDTVKTETKSNGDKTVTVTDKDGNVVAKLEIPAHADLGYKFEDVPDNHWAEPSIQAMAAMKVFQGVSSTRHIFDMNSSVTRGTMAQILFNMSQGKAGINNPFTDAQGNWYSDAVAWAASVGVVTGVSDTNFAPNDSITREQLITMLYRYAQLLALDTNVTADMGKFVDADEIDSWASAAMTWAVGKGLIIGKGAGNLDPTAAASRAEAAVIIDRFLQMV